MDGKAGHWVLRFISGKYQGSEVPLETERELLVGRASNTDLVLMEDMVSRKHAKLGLVEGEVFIQDLGSTNGTFVNGERVKRSVLHEGDRVLIGTSIFKVVRQDSPATSSLETQEGGKAQQEGVSTLRPRPLQGDISEQGLPSLVQLLGTSKQTGRLEVQGPRFGRLVFRDGQLMSAAVEGAVPLSGKKALYRIFTWTQGPFSVTEAEVPTQRDFKEPTDALVAEAIRHGDEARRARERLPAGVQRFRVPQPLAPALKDLSPKRLDTFQLVFNVGDLEGILDRNPVSDLDTYRHLLFLLQKEYIQVAA